ncbi:MAG: hypothetical protein V4574_02075 [Pseudomonadota bacterium]
MLALSACAGPVGDRGIDTVSMRYLRAPLQVDAPGADEVAVVDAKGCSLKRRDRAIVVDMLGKARLRKRAWGEAASPAFRSALLITVHAREGASWFATLPSPRRGDGAVDIRIDGDDAHIAPADLAMLQAIAARNGCRFSVRREKAA